MQLSNRCKHIFIVISVRLKTEAIEQYMALHFKNIIPQNELKEHVISTGIPRVFRRETSGKRLEAMRTFDHPKRFRLEKGHSATTVCRRCVLNAHFKTLMKVRELICHG